MITPPAPRVRLRRAEVCDLHLILDAIRTPEDLLMWAGPRDEWPLSYGRLAADLMQMTATGTCLPWVVVDACDDTSVGYVELTVSAETAIGHVSRVLVHPDARGRGLGRELMDAVIATAFDDHELATVTLNVHERNATARSLYEHLGFTYLTTGPTENLRMQLRRGDRPPPVRRARMATDLTQVRVVLFDVFGTLVDWRTSVARELAAFGAERGLARDWNAVADDWRAEYQPSMEQVRLGRRPWTMLDTLHRESLERVFAAHEIRDVASVDLDALTLSWHRLDPWPDVVTGLAELRRHVKVGTLSNGNTSLLNDLTEHGGLSFDHVLGAETAMAYKPTRASYLRNVAVLDLHPHEVMLAAAHNSDLHAASGCGLRTAFIPRPTEHGPRQVRDLEPTGHWDVVAPDLSALARALGPHVEARSSRRPSKV